LLSETAESVCSRSPPQHRPALAPYVVTRLIVNLTRSTIESESWRSIRLRECWLSLPIAVIASSTRTRRTYPSHRPTDRECHSSSENAPALRSSRARREASAGPRSQFFEVREGWPALSISVFIDRFIEHRFLAVMIAFSWAQRANTGVLRPSVFRHPWVEQACSGRRPWRERSATWPVARALGVEHRHVPGCRRTLQLVSGQTKKSGRVNTRVQQTTLILKMRLFDLTEVGHRVGSSKKVRTALPWLSIWSQIDLSTGQLRSARAELASSRLPRSTIDRRCTWAALRFTPWLKTY